MTLSHQPYSPETRRRRFALFTREAFILLVYMAVAASVLNIFMQTRSFKEGDTSREFTFSKMLEGSAKRPYVYRQLAPMIANYGAGLLSAGEQREFVERYLDKFHLHRLYFGNTREMLEFDAKLVDEWTPAYAIKYHIVYLLIFFGLLGALYCLRGLAPPADSNQKLLAPFIPAIFVLLIPLFFKHGNFSYDFIELFFLSALLLAALRGHYAWWLLLLPLAALNKESNILVPLLYLPAVLVTGRSWRSRLWIALGWIFSLVIYQIIKHKFANNPGDTVAWQLGDKLLFLINPKNYFLWHDFFAPMIPFPRGFNILSILVFSGLVFSGWKTKPALDKSLFYAGLAINIPLFLLFTQTDEIRNLSFLFLPIYLLSRHTLMHPDAGAKDELRQTA